MCYNIPTDIVLANIFHEYRDDLTVSQLLKYVDHLQSTMDKYVWTDISDTRIKEIAKTYPTLYSTRYTDDGELVVCPQGGFPNLNAFNRIYSESTRKYIEHITKSYVKDELLAHQVFERIE